MIFSPEVIPLSVSPFNSLVGCLTLCLLGSVTDLSHGQPPVQVPGPAMEVKISEHENRLLSNVRQVTAGFEKAGEGYFSPDGKTVIYQAIRREYPFYQIYTQPLESDRPRLISTGRGRTTCSYFSPDGQHLIFASSHLDPQLYETEEQTILQEEADRKSGVHRRYSWPFDPAMDIFETDLHGRVIRRLTSAPGYDAEGAFSKDGTKIAFCSTRDGDPDIYVMNADGTDVQQLTDAPGYDGGPFISPNGRWVVFRSDRKEPEHLQIRIVSIDGKLDLAVTDDEHAVHWGPYWHPTAPYIIWSGADHSDPKARPNYDLWMVRYTEKENGFEFGERIRVTDFAGADVLPVFSPDGKKLMWTSTRTADHTSQLFIGDFKMPE
jgi:Tol biopolymer transport system component